MKNGFLIIILLISGLTFSQTTINLENQCNCEVIKGTDVTFAGANTPIADQGDIYINTNTGILYYWNGSAWELTSGKNTVNKTFTVVGADLVITDSDGETVKVALSDIANGVNTDDQNLGLAKLDTDNILSIGIEDGTGTTVDLSLLDESAEVTELDTRVATNETDIAANKTAIDAHIAADEDTDAENELQDLVLAGDMLKITNNASATEIDLSGYISSDNQNLGLAELDTDNILSIGIEDGIGTTVDLSLLDESAEVTALDTRVTANTSNITTNTTDITALQTDKEDASNKSNDIALGTSDALFPTQNAVKTYVDGAITASTQTIVSDDADNDVKEGTDGGAFYDDAALQTGISDNAIAIATNKTAIESNDADITALDGQVTTNTSDIAANKTAIDAHIVADEDTDAENEIQDLVLTGDMLKITNNASATEIDLSGYISSDNQNLGLAELDTDNVLSIGIEDGIGTTVDLSLLDESAEVTALDTRVTANTSNITTNASDITALQNDKEDASNKSNDAALGTSDALFPTQNAVKTYVDGAITASAQTIVSADMGNDIEEGADGGAFYDDAALQTGISDNATAITANTTAIQSNTSAITANETAIATSKAAIESNDADITALQNDKEDASNKSNDAALGTSDALFPTQNAVKTYVDGAITASTQTIVSDDADNDVKEGTDGGAFYDDAALQTGISDNATAITANETAIATNKAAIESNDADITALQNDKEDASNKSNDAALGTSDALFPTQNAVKTYVDGAITASAQTIVSADMGNDIEEGADGGAFYDDAALQTGISDNAIAIATNKTAIESNDADITALDGQVTTNTSDIAANKTAIDAHIVADEDTDAENEIQDLVLTGDMLKITNNASATEIDLSGYISSDNQNLGLAELDTDNVLSIGIEDGIGTTVDLSLLDESAEVTALDTRVAANTSNITTNASDITALQTDKEDASNKSNDAALGTSDALFPTQNAVKTYVDGAITASTQTIVSDDADNDVKEGTDGGAFYDDATLQTGISDNATAIATNKTAIESNDADITALQNDKEDASNKSNDAALGTSDALFPTQNAVKTYVDGAITASTQTIVSDDADNDVKEGTDGGAFYDDAVLQTGISDNATAITANTTAIQSNTTAITANETAIATNKAAIESNDADITALQNDKEDASNKSNDAALGTSDALFPTQNAVKTYVDGAITASAQTIVSADMGNDIEEGADGGAFYDDAALQTGISDNAIAIATNKTAIESNDADITALDGQVTTNTSDIAANKTAIDAHIVADEDTDAENEIQDLVLTGDMLKITNNASATDIDLSGYMDNTDAQELSLVGNELSIANGNSVTLPSSDGSETEIVNGTTTTVTGNGTTASKYMIEVADEAITSAKILNRTIVHEDIADGAINAYKILDGAVEASKLNADVVGAGLKQNTVTKALEVDIENINGDGNITSTDLVVGGDNNALLGDVTLDIKADAITNTKLADNAVQTENILDKNITVEKLSSGSATNGQVAMADGSSGVTYATLKTSQVDLDTATDVDGNGTNETNSNEAILAMTKVTAKAARIFYPPSIAIDASSVGAKPEVDLYSEYQKQYGTPMVTSTGAPSAIPTYGRGELYYYITYYDTNVFSGVTVNVEGKLNYTVSNVPSDYNSLINVVFVVK